jgi:hypothetical protein
MHAEQGASGIPKLLNWKKVYPIWGKKKKREDIEKL